MKVCAKCKVEKENDEFYKKPSGKCRPRCKECTKQERVDKYHTGNVSMKKPEKKRKQELKTEFYAKYPEKKGAHYAAGHIKKSPGNIMHHWSYNEEHWKDTIELSSKDHGLIHRYLKYSQPYKMYITKAGMLLYTRELHEKYITEIIQLYGKIYRRYQQQLPQ